MSLGRSILLGWALWIFDAWYVGRLVRASREFGHGGWEILNISAFAGVSVLFALLLAATALCGWRRRHHSQPFWLGLGCVLFAGGLALDGGAVVVFGGFLILAASAMWGAVAKQRLS